MKRKILLFICLFFSFFIFAKGQFNSWNGLSYVHDLNPHRGCRMLNMFINVIYDVHPDTNDVFTLTDWPKITDATMEGVNNAGIPNYLLDFMDTAYHVNALHGTITRLYGESSFDSLQFIGDFVVVNVRESRVLNLGQFNYETIKRAAVDIINENGGLHTIYGHDAVADYDYLNSGYITFTNVLIRNITLDYGKLKQGSGFFGNTIQNLKIGGNFYSSKNGTLQCVGSGNIADSPTSIVVHEISHAFFGDNNFHTSGGNHRGGGCTMSFPNIQYGYGLMGAAGSSLVGCNGYERWRMHWKHPQAVDYIAARNLNNTQSVISDITLEDGEQSFLLRDFVTYGDVVRIKLPYKDSENSSNQYIWLENHQIGNNGKLDFLQHSNVHDCRQIGKSGIYAYYQVGRDVLSGSQLEVWDTCDRDNLKIITAEGYYDYEKVDDSYNLYCVSYGNHNHTFVRGKANPFCGAQDQQLQFFPADEDTVLQVSAEYPMWRKIINADTLNNLPCLGDTLDAFTAHTVLNMGTNPSTCNTLLCHSNNSDGKVKAEQSFKDTRTIYLTGLRIELLPQDNGSCRVNVQWNDYDIENDVRWTGPIALKDTARLTAGKTMTLAQNRTVVQTEWNQQTGLFSPATQLKCLEGSLFVQDTNSVVTLTENSTLLLGSGSRFVMMDSAEMVVQQGCTLLLEDNAQLVVGNAARIIVDSVGTVIIKDSAKFGKNAQLIVRPGGKLVADGGTLTNSCDGQMWQGVIVEGNRTKRQTSANQGVLELKNGATIENALCGVRLGLTETDITHTGGILYAINATFRNCARAINFLPYVIDSCRSNVSYCKYCDFVVDNNNLFAANNVSFSEHVRLCDVTGVKFSACNFANRVTQNLLSAKAVNAENAGFWVTDDCPIQYTGTNCPNSNTIRSTFTGFHTAIKVNTTGHQFYVGINNAFFHKNLCGVNIAGNDHVSITRSSFLLDSVPNGTLPMLPAYGLCLTTCTGFQVEGNTFERSSYSASDNRCGMIVHNLGYEANDVYHNAFKNLTNGVMAFGANGRQLNSGGSGLCFSCNNFSGNGHDLYIDTLSSVCPNQGSMLLGADNTFGNTLNSHITNRGTTSLKYYYSSGRSHSPSVVNGRVRVYSGATPNGCDYTWNSSQNPGGGLANSQISYPMSNDAEDVHQTVLETNALFRQYISRDAYALSDLQTWYAALPTLSARYALAETQFQNGNISAASATLQSIPMDFALTDEQREEYDNYMAFHALKVALCVVTPAETLQETSLQTVTNWPAATPEQIAELQRIIDSKTGRSSEMAKSVLCFFFDICYDDVLDVGGTRSCQDDDSTMYASFFSDSAIMQYDIAEFLTCYVSPDDYDPGTLGPCTDTYSFRASTSDTAVFNGKVYYTFSCDYIGDKYYIREERKTGRVYRYYTELDSEYLWCDMSLMEGDTFQFPLLSNGVNYCSYDAGGQITTVENVEYVNGRKVIYLTCLKGGDYVYQCWSGEPRIYRTLMFIEGIGPTYGLFGFTGVSTERVLGILLCVHHGDSLVYMQHPDLGCYQALCNVDDKEKPIFKIYPNPASQAVTVDFGEFECKNGTIIVRDMAGVVVRTLLCNEQKMQVDIANLSSGMYAVTYYDGARKSTRTFVKVK